MISTQFVSQLQLRRDDVPSFDTYPFSLPAVRNLDVLKLHPKVTFLVGENGSGKSTLLEAIAVSFGFNPEGGSKNFTFSTRASHSDLHKYLRLGKGYRKPADGFFLRAESFFNLGTEIEALDREFAFSPPIINSYGYRSLHEQSHGESFMALLMNRFGGNGFYVLDEPEAALSPQRQLAVLARIHELANAGSQFVIATHSPLLMMYPHALLYSCTEAGLRLSGAEETLHYQVMRDFFQDPHKLMRATLA
jgi:predicted ATPase